MSRKQWKICLAGAFFYGIAHWLMDNEIKNAGMAEILTACFELLFWTIILFLLIRGKQNEKWKITCPACGKADWWLFAVPAVQCIVYGVKKQSGAAILHLLASAMGEELIFRSFIPLILTEKTGISDRKRMFLCAGVFALFHLVNLFGMESIGQVIVQGSYAFCAGIALYALAEKQHSIVNTVVLHFLINLTATENTLCREEILLTVLFAGLFFIFGMIYTITKEKRNT